LEIAEPPLFAGPVKLTESDWLEAEIDEIVGASATVATGVPDVAELATPL
jgi:hypothetical protein